MNIKIECHHCKELREMVAFLEKRTPMEIDMIKIIFKLIKGGLLK